MNRRNQPIFAVCTSPVRAPLHVQRVSGHGALAAISPFLTDISAGRALLPEKWPPHTAVPRTLHTRLINHTGETLDNVLITGFASPHSFTGEDVFEISSHGNPIILSRIQSFFRQIGFTDALPGEFTQRAFLNGKMDLTEAEAIHELINARSSNAIKIAQGAAHGSIAKEVKQLREKLLTMMAYLEAHIDFDESDVGTFLPSTLVKDAEELYQALQKLAQTYDSSSCARNGVKVCITGRPNAGKSTIFNTLLKKERAIVTEIAGTTRDVIEDHFLFRNRDFVFQDTAGLRLSQDKVEQLGIERSFKSVAAADVICLLVDASLDSSSESARNNFFEVFEEIRNIIESKVLIIAVAKSDITPQLCIQSVLDAAANAAVANPLSVSLSVSRENPDALLEALCAAHDQCANSGIFDLPAVLISTRQRDCVLRAAEYAQQATLALESQQFPESVASLLCATKNEIEDIVGVVTPSDVLEKLFSHFCIGK